MNSQLQVNNILQQLSTQKRCQVSLHGWQLLIEFSSEEGLFISVPVYKGEGYFPPSVREALKSNQLEGLSHLKTYYSVDEDGPTITLRYQGPAQDLARATLLPLLEEFSWVAEQSWHYFDDRDKHDLVHLPVK